MSKKRIICSDDEESDEEVEFVEFNGVNKDSIMKGISAMNQRDDSISCEMCITSRWSQCADDAPQNSSSSSNSGGKSSAKSSGMKEGDADSTQEMKTCSNCNVEKPITKFYTRSNGTPRGVCKQCIRDQQKARYAANPEVKRDYSLRSLYDITLEQRNELSEKQDHLCAICNEDGAACRQKKKKKKNGVIGNLVVDHDHKITTHIKIRAMLCNRCNVALGMVDDNVTLLHAMIAYVEKHQSEKE